MTMFNHFWTWKNPLYWLPTGFVLSHYFYNVNVISGRSMQPTLNPDTSSSRDVAIFHRHALFTRDAYQRDDIITLRSPEDPRRTLIKRIIALEGDVVRTLPPYPARDVRVPIGHIWVEGDEPFYSDDSNIFGPVPMALVESKLVCIIWPLHRFGRVSKAELPLSRNGPSFRRAMAQFDRERARESRVTKV